MDSTKKSVIKTEFVCTSISDLVPLKLISKMSNRWKLKENNENNFKDCKAKKPLGDLNLNIPASTNTGAIKKSLHELCKSEIKNIIKIPNKRPKSANCIEQSQKFNFDILEETTKGITNKNQKLKTDFQKIKNDKENKPKNVQLIEKEWEERRLYRQKHQLDSTKSHRQRICSEGSFTKSVVDYEPPKSTRTSKQIDNNKRIQFKPDLVIACRKPIRTLIDDNTIRIKTRKVSPIRPNTFTVDVSAVIRLPKLRRRDTSQNASRSSNCYYDFNEDILPDILKMGMEQEKKILLPKNFLSVFNHDANNRYTIVNWMLSIQYLFNIPDCELYIAVSLLDQVLARIAVPKNMYQLVGMTCILLSNKFIGSDELIERELLIAMNSVYAIAQLKCMEFKIFKLLDFSIHSIEPSVYINTYLKLANLDPTSEKYFDIFFCVDNALHLSSYSSTPTSVVAKAAMFLAFTMFENASLENVINDLKRELKADEVGLCRTMELSIISQIKKINESKFKNRFAILNKYKNCAWTSLEVQ